MYTKCYIPIIAIILCTIYRDIIAIGNSSLKESIYLNNNYSDHFLSSKLSRNKRQLLNYGQTCEFPVIPYRTKYTILGQTVPFGPGNFIAESHVLEVSCDDGYHLVSPFAQKFSICVGGKWTPSPTSCSRACPALVSTESTTVKCSYDGRSLPNCFNPVDKTRAQLSCPPYYEEASLARNPHRVCRNGNWIPSIVKCYPTCGIKSPRGTPTIIGGNVAIRGDYPWQVGIYNTKKELICGGAIIDNYAVLSAAHCFTDPKGKVFSNENYHVASGKYFREYNDSRDDLAQFSDVIAIHVPDRYSGQVNFLSQDIAVVILKNPFRFSEVVQPICIEINAETQQLHISENDNGTVTGWGHTQEGKQLSDVLKELVVPYIPYHQCSMRVPSNFRSFITYDKFCSGYLNQGMSVCSGDSGGALAFKNLVDDRYYAIGIVSVSPATTEVAACNSNTYSVFTGVSHHIQFVVDYLLYYKPDHPVECKSLEDCRQREIQENKYGCRYPNFPSNGKYILLGQNNTYIHGDYVPIGSMLTLSCDIGYKVSVSGTALSVCVSKEQWKPSPGSCEVSGLDSGPRIETPETARVQDHRNIRLLPAACGINKYWSNRVYNGNRTKINESPWLALLSYQTPTGISYKCGGTVINNRYILTAAHCLVGSLLGVRLGEYSIEDTKDCQIEDNKEVCADSVQDFYIAERIIHPRYNQPEPSNDIGLIRLDSPINFTTSVKAICLPIQELSKSIATGAIFTVNGWGLLDFSYLRDPSASHEVMQTDVEIVSPQYCQQKYSKYEYIITEYQICALTENGSDTRIVDGGSPIQTIEVIADLPRYVQIGLLSNEPNHYAGRAQPGIYTRLDKYLNWVLDNISN